MSDGIFPHLAEIQLREAVAQMFRTDALGGFHKEMRARRAMRGIVENPPRDAAHAADGELRLGGIAEDEVRMAGADRSLETVLSQSFFARNIVPRQHRFVREGASI
ncbi:hypothetical protein [Thioclava indica]|uniref:hypothetical protein n=1 Tax=Thioclava indica TaxID=1353528 RepID=UPI001F0B4F43|nr:hypothetical protein [Thioclava indica]